MKTYVDENRPPHPQITEGVKMADHSALALAGAYCRYLYERTGTPPSAMREAYFRSTGETPAGYPHRFRKWLGQRVYMMDQLGKHPFPDDDR